MYTVYSMRTIMIKDEVYNMLASIKEDKSFSETINSLIKKNTDIRKANLIKLYGIIDEKKANEMMVSIKEVRSNARANTFG
ncbi:MAG: antitoxin [Candidatus Diapherotrites archaeon CG08_land_8_20_14_0_20_30_16]|nr:MAG: antitoxin [Candidatus Diapherotrites archaeon CG08_land_8_20_14_0_20_30_16]